MSFKWQIELTLLWGMLSIFLFRFQLTSIWPSNFCRRDCKLFIVKLTKSIESRWQEISVINSVCPMAFTLMLILWRTSVAPPVKYSYRVELALKVLQHSFGISKDMLIIWSLRLNLHQKWFKKDESLPDSNIIREMNILHTVESYIMNSSVCSWFCIYRLPVIWTIIPTGNQMVA